MNNNKEHLAELLSALTQSLSDEELLLAAVQGRTSSAIAAGRIAKGYSQKEFAEKMGVSQSLVSRWENSECNFTLQTLAKIALALDLNMDSPFSEARPKWKSVSNKVIDFPIQNVSYAPQDPSWFIFTAENSIQKTELLEM